MREQNMAWQPQHNLLCEGEHVLTLWIIHDYYNMNIISRIQRLRCRLIILSSIIYNLLSTSFQPLRLEPLSTSVEPLGTSLAELERWMPVGLAFLLWNNCNKTERFTCTVRRAGIDLLGLRYSESLFHLFCGDE